MEAQRTEGAKGAPRPELLPGLSPLIVAATLVVAVFNRKSMPAYMARLGLEVAAPILLAAGAHRASVPSLIGLVIAG